MKGNSYYAEKGTIIQTKWQAIEWEKIFTKYISNRGLIPKIHKEFKKLEIKKINNPIKIGTELNREFLNMIYK